MKKRQSGGSCDGQTGQCVFVPAAEGDAWAKRFGGGTTTTAVNPAIAVRPCAPGVVSGDIAVTGTFSGGDLVFDETFGVQASWGGGSDVFVTKMLSVQSSRVLGGAPPALAGGAPLVHSER